MANIELSELTEPIHGIGGDGSGAGKLKAILEAIESVCSSDPVCTDQEVARALDVNASDKKVIQNIRQHTYSLRMAGKIEWKGNKDGMQCYAIGDGEKKTKKTKK